MKFKEFCEKIKYSNVDYFNSLSESVKRQWKEEFNQINRAKQLENSAKIKFIQLSDTARLPMKSAFGNVHSLYSTKDVYIEKGRSAVICTGVIADILSDNNVLMLSPSHIIAMNGIILANSGEIITSAQRKDEIKIKLCNHSDTTFHVRPNDCIAKAVFLKTENMAIAMKAFTD